MREHLDEAHAAADRLVHEAQRQAEEASGNPREPVPPRGWDSGHGEASRGLDLHGLLGLLDTVRDAVGDRPAKRRGRHTNPHDL